jgi:hypothetical protein
LALGGPRDKAAPKKNSVDRSGASSVRTTGPISISVNNELSWSSPGKDKTKVESALEIPENPFGSHQMSLPGIMHMEADLLNSICNIRPGEGEVLKGTGKAAVGGGIKNWRTSISGYFGASIGRGKAGFAVAHAVSVEDVQSVLTLGKEQRVLVALNSYTEEEVKGTKVLHRKFLFQGNNDSVEKLSGQSSEHNIINVEEQMTVS